MIEKKFIQNKKHEYNIKEFIKKNYGKGKVSNAKIERTPLGEKIIIVTSKPGVIIGGGGKNIYELTELLKEKFKLNNPQIEIEEVKNVFLDPQTIADKIALSLENFGPLKFKGIAYRTLQQIIDNGVLGVEIVLSGKLPGAKAKTWRFSYGYLKKTGEYSKTLVKKAKALAFTRPGVVGIKVSIVPPGTNIPDKVEIKKGVSFEKIKDGPEKEEEKKIKKKPKKKGKLKKIKPKKK